MIHVLGHIWIDLSRPSLIIPPLVMMMQDGRTALMMAANNGHLEVVRLLLEKDADIQAKDEVSYVLFIFPYLD
jgi:hypothetical protein